MGSCVETGTRSVEASRVITNKKRKSLTEQMFRVEDLQNLGVGELSK